MRASIVSTALVAALLCAVSDAARTSVNKQRSTAFLSASVTVDAQRRSQMGSKEMGLLQQTQKQMSSDIDEVQKVLKVALVELEQWVQKEPANATNSTIAHPKVQGNSSKVPSTEKAGKKGDAIEPTMNKSSKVVAALDSKKARVQKVAQTQEAVLENLFKHLKSNIVNLNKEEGSAKEVAAKSMQRLQKRLKAEQAELQKKGLSSFEHDRLVNRTRTDTFELQYWTRDRSLGHQMFHTNLKMQHGLMSRVHEVIAACKEAALKGHLDPAMMKKLQAQSTPKAFIEMRSNLNHKAQQYYAHVLTARWMVAEESESE